MISLRKLSFILRYLIQGNNVELTFINLNDIVAPSEINESIKFALSLSGPEMLNFVQWI